MVAKINRGASLYGAIIYNLQKVNDNTARIIYGLLKYDVRYDDLNTIGEAKWDQIIRYGMEFAAEVCKSYSNSVSNEFAERCKY